MKIVESDLLKSLVSHPTYKQLVSSYSTSSQDFTISQFPTGIKQLMLRQLESLFGGNFILYEGNDKPEFKVVNKSCSYSEILQILNDMNYVRVEEIANSREFVLKGDVIYLNNPAYLGYVRIDFWGDHVEEISIINDLTLKKMNVLGQFIISPREIKLFGEKKSFSNITLGFTNDNPEFLFDFTDVYSLGGNMALLRSQIDSYISRGYKVIISTKYQDILGEFDKDVFFTKYIFVEGFKTDALKIILLTDSELFDNLVIVNPDEEGDYFVMGDIKVGDYVVHKNHGVGIYGGVEMVALDGIKNEYIILKYAKGDKLYVPREKSHYISKYVGTGHAPKLTRLGSKEWSRIKSRVRKSLESITKDLLELYAKRSLKKGFRYSLDNSLLDEFIKDFEFEETKDQKRSWEEICSDMEGERPMDRLLVGDVGFGKTEIAMRAAFKAIQDKRQVVLLAPTTVLVEQHYAVMKDRYLKYPINIEVLSRFRKDDSLKSSLELIRNGGVDLIIGTHRILSKDVQFKDLGLLIIDEEQRFGVKQKEVLKKMRENIDVLSMSATPIPRSLNMSLTGIKDISILLEPPTGRKPIKTYLMKFEYEKIVDILLREKHRGGQSYLVHNNINTINTFVEKLKELSPEISYVVGHGKMSGEVLSSVMRDFHANKYDVLVCTTIIENGIDMPNVNTIIIDNAHNLGLSQLHQLRGRVGRSNQQAYCYAIYPKEFVPNSTAQKRLDMLIEAQALGSGFLIASKDLEIRGAGNLLGREQSGNICSVGYSLYIELLKQQIKRMQKIK